MLDVRLITGHAGAAADEREVHVGVDETGQQRGAAAIDDDVGRKGTAGRLHGRDPALLDDDVAPGGRVAAGSVQDGHVPDHDPAHL